MDDDRPYQLVISTKNVKHRDGILKINDIDLNSIKFHVQSQDYPTAEQIYTQHEKLLEQKLGQRSSTGKDLFLSKRQYEMKQSLKKDLSFLESEDSWHEILYKYYVTQESIAWNLESFNMHLKQESRDEDLAREQLISTQKMIELQGEMNDLYQTAEMMRSDMNKLMS